MRDALYRDIRFTRTEQAIIEAIRVLLDQKDFHAITTNDICVQATVSRTTFYQHFEDKYDLVLAWIQTDIIPHSEIFTDETMELYFNRLLDSIQLHIRRLRHLIQHGSTRELESRIIAMISVKLQKYYENRVRQGARTETPCQMMAIFNCTGALYLIWWFIRSDFPYTREDVVNYVVKNIQAAR